MSHPERILIAYSGIYAGPLRERTMLSGTFERAALRHPESVAGCLARLANGQHHPIRGLAAREAMRDRSGRP